MASAINKRPDRILHGLFWVLLIGCVAMPPAMAAGEIGIITASHLNVRPEPGTGKPPVMTLPRGTTVTVIHREKGWIKIQYRTRTGWVKDRERYIRLMAGPAEPVPGTPPADAAVTRAQKEAKAIQRKIAAGNAEVVTFNRKEVEIVSSLNTIDFALNAARNRRNALHADLEALGKKMRRTETAIFELSEKLIKGREYAAGRLVALYKLSRIGRIHILASATSIYELFQREATLERVLDHDRKVLTALAENKAALRKMLNVQQVQKAEKKAIEADLKKQIAAITQKKSQRQALLADIRSKKSLQMAAIDALRQSAKDLDEKIRMLSLQQVRTETSFSVPDKPFADLKGLLKMPVQGKIISKYGTYRNTQFNVVNFRSGIDIQADRGEPIRAVCHGKVVFASWFKNYGNMIIINHGGHFHTVYANIEELFKKVGDTVAAGEVVATVGDTGSEIGPKLYFEIREDRKAVDPLKWVDSG